MEAPGHGLGTEYTGRSPANDRAGLETLPGRKKERHLVAPEGSDRLQADRVEVGMVGNVGEPSDWFGSNGRAVEPLGVLRADWRENGFLLRFSAEVRLQLPGGDDDELSQGRVQTQGYQV